MYRESIYEFIKGEATLLLPKQGGLFDYMWDLLPEIGLEEVVMDLDLLKRKALDKLTIGDLTVQLVRGEDISQRVMDSLGLGRNTYGLTGDDLYDEWRLTQPENPLEVKNTYDWVDKRAIYGRPALCVVNRSGELGKIRSGSIIALNRKYVNTSKLALEDSLKDMSFLYRVYSGDTEKVVEAGNASAAVDIVYSGSTLESTGLKIAACIRTSDLSLIGSK
ncbi:hypothetical protein H6504_05075 [Candidatus Woesearchaeota archaeon]|nr:hypothetical protein [Candidatus Woesearchaeota archaeon]